MMKLAKTFFSSEIFISVAKRFPESFLFCIIGTAIGFYAVSGNHYEFFFLPRLLWLSAIGFLGFLLIRVDREPKSPSVWELAIAYISYGFFSLMVLSSTLAFQKICSFTFGLCLLTLSLPFMRKKNQNDYFWSFAHDIFIAFFYATLLCGVLNLGMLAVLTSLKYLFGLDLLHWMKYLFICSQAFLAPCYFLVRFPSSTRPTLHQGLPKDARLISSYVCIPFVWTYLFILYAYLIKLALAQTVPAGQLGWMIAAFGTSGILTHLIAYPMRENGNFAVRSYLRYFYPALLLPALLLGYSLSIRVKAYGITESRFLLGLIGIWFVLTSLYFLLRDKQAELKYVPLSLAVLLLVTTFGPWSMTSVSLRSQRDRLESILARNDRFKEGHLKISDAVVSFEDRKEITSLFDYFADENRWLSLEPALILTAHPPLQKVDEKSKNLDSVWGRRQDHIKILQQATNVEPAHSYEMRNFNAFSFNTQSQLNDMIAIQGYSILTRVSNVSNSGSRTTFGNLQLQLQGPILHVYTNGDREIIFDLLPLINQSFTSHELAQPVVLKSEVSGFKAKIIITNLSGQKMEDGSYRIDSIYATLLTDSQP